MAERTLDYVDDWRVRLRVMDRVLLSLGSNVGEREVVLVEGLRALDGLEGSRVVRRSSLYETSPWGRADQRAFYNLGVELDTGMGPRQLLSGLKQIETALGREEGPRWGPRRIDIDIILWGQRVIAEQGLHVPHPAFRKRAFVLVPLSEIAPEAIDPETGLTLRELSARPESEGRVNRITWTA